MTLLRPKAAIALACLLATGLFMPVEARAQSATTAAISGRVTNAQGQGVPNANVGVVNVATGSSSGVTTRVDGRYVIPGLQPGQYRVSASAIGFAPISGRQVTLTLGQTASYDITMSPQAVTLEGLTVVAEENPVISSGRTGMSTVVSDSALRRTPTITRDLQDFTRLVPQLAVTNSTTGSISAGGRNNRYNQLQVDGAANSDLYGISQNGSPSGQAGGKPITLEAIQELQVLIAPFDVRQNGFTGASINAITRSGTNEFKVSASGFTRNEGFVGRYVTNDDTASAKLTAFESQEIAGSIGGPIIRDKAFFFAAAERSERTDPLNYVAADTSLNGVSVGQATLVRDRLTALGYDPGGYEDRDVTRESLNLFGRLDFNFGENHRLTVRHNYIDGFRQDFSRSATSYNLNNGGYSQTNTTHSSVLQLNSGLPGGIFNEFRVGYLRIRDFRDIPGELFPRVEVRFGSSNRAVFAGSENSSVANRLDQDAFEFTNDVTIPMGEHTITVGTNNEFAKFTNLFAQNIYGNYRFDTYADFLAGRPSQYLFRYLVPDNPATEADESGDPSPPLVWRRYSLYAQDQWDVLDNLQLTLGLRWERPTFPEDPKENPAVFNMYGRHTSIVNNSQNLWNPRLGFNWDVFADATTQVRGGAGLFSGRAPFVWITNAYANTGLDYVSFTCTGTTAAPTFVPDPLNQPRNCLGTTSAAANDVNIVQPDLKLPQVARYNLGIDREIPFGLVLTLEGLYTKNINEMLFKNLRLERVPLGLAEGRPLYRNRNTPGLGAVIDVTNTSKGSSYSLTSQIQRPFRNNWDFSLAYTFSRSEDLAPLNNSTAFSSWSFNLTRRDPNAPELTLSDRDVPHRFISTASYRLTLVERFATDLSLVYVGQSGKPYSFRYGSDINGDGATGNDLVFVPETQDQIRFFQPAGNPITPQQSWDNLNAFIEETECLREARGTIIARNTCREPWSNRFDFRVAQNVTAIRGHTAQITLDILNVGNLLNREWGRSAFQNNQAENLLTLATGTGSTPAPDLNGRRQYAPFGPRSETFTISNLDSRYQLQLGARYSF